MIFVPISLPQQKSNSMNQSKHEYRMTIKYSTPADVRTVVTYEPTKTKALKAAADAFNDDDVFEIKINKEQVHG